MVKGNKVSLHWRTMDIHIHTPASSDYQQENVSYLDILHEAEGKGLDIIAFTDHNTVAGSRKMLEEIRQLESLRELKRLLPEESDRLTEYQRLLEKILVLPGFEFSATFGFHILAIFPPEKSLRELEHLLLTLKIPADQLDEGSATVGATSDVLYAYEQINNAGGMVIAAHANSSNGVAMRGFRFGGQTKIAYTQDSNLHALEVTDLQSQDRKSTAAFFNGTKPEYPRRMHCIQGSDAHRLDLDINRKKNLGIGDRSTEILIQEVTFAALMELFSSNDFARTRPHHKRAVPAYDYFQEARKEGANIVQDFHPSMTVRGGKLYSIIADVCAFANTNGGSLYIGCVSDPKVPVTGILNANQAKIKLEKEINSRISPQINFTVDITKVENKDILRVLIDRGDDAPYAVDGNKIYIREEAETGSAVRDEIVGLVLRNQKASQVSVDEVPKQIESPREREETDLETPFIDFPPPRTGVEVVCVETRNGSAYYTVRDLRNGNVVKNVTIASARRLWHYAIKQYAELPEDLTGLKINWQNEFGLYRRYQQGNSLRFDLIQRTQTGYRYYYGVTEDGIHGDWKQIVGEEDNRA